MSACVPVASGVIADLFDSSARGLASGIFNLGVYYGFGMAFVLGIYGTGADLLGYGWRVPYVAAAAPGFAIAILIAITVSDYPRIKAGAEAGTGEKTPTAAAASPLTGRDFYMKVAKSFFSPTMLVLLVAASFRHTAGFAWAYNMRSFYQMYHPDAEPGLEVFVSVVVGGGMGVAAGGYLSDRAAVVMGGHSRLWVLSATTLIATPMAVLVMQLIGTYNRNFARINAVFFLRSLPTPTCSYSPISFSRRPGSPSCSR